MCAAIRAYTGQESAGTVLHKHGDIPIDRECSRELNPAQQKKVHHYARSDQLMQIATKGFEQRIFPERGTVALLN